jgi:hypothetical protein
VEAAGVEAAGAEAGGAATEEATTSTRITGAMGVTTTTTATTAAGAFTTLIRAVTEPTGPSRCNAAGADSRHALHGSRNSNLPYAVQVRRRRISFSLWQAPLIPRLFNQNPCAQSRSPMDIIRHGWSVSLFQASQQ